MKKFLKLTTVVVSMVMALTFVSCANGNTSNNGNENSNDGQLNLVGTYGISKIEDIYKNPKSEASFTMTMPTSTSLRQYGTHKLIDNETTTVIEMDVTITKTADGYSSNWAKYDINGVAQDDEAKTEQETQFGDNQWNEYTAMFAMTITTTADGTWSDNNTPSSSGTYTVDEENSKVIIKILMEGEETLQDPKIMEATYSNNGKTLVVVQEYSSDEETGKTTMTLTRK